MGNSPLSLYTLSERTACMSQKHLSLFIVLILDAQVLRKIVNNYSALASASSNLLSLLQSDETSGNEEMPLNHSPLIEVIA